MRNPLATSFGRVVALIALAIATTSPGPALAEDIFLDIEGVQGESRDQQHKNEIDVLAWSWNLSTPNSQEGATRRRGAAIVDDIKIVKHIDKASTKLSLGLLQGMVYPTAELVVRSDEPDAEPIEYLKIELTNVLVTRVAQGGAGSDNRLTETIALNFEEVKVTYTPIGPDGLPEASHEYEWRIEEGEI